MPFYSCSSEYLDSGCDHYAIQVTQLPLFPNWGNIFTSDHNLLVKEYTIVFMSAQVLQYCQDFSITS
jgi:hypothetical protein